MTAQGDGAGGDDGGAAAACAGDGDGSAAAARGGDDVDGPGDSAGGVWPVDRRAVLRSAGTLPVGVAAGAGGAGAVDGAAEAVDTDAVTDATADDEARTVPDLPAAFDGWRAGDLHVHSHHSHDVCADPTACEEPYTYGFSVGQQIAHAEARGLDYLAITDHNTVAQFDDEEYESEQLALVRGYEHSLARGHGGILGVDRVYDRPTDTDGRMRALMDEVDRDGGIGVANHPRTNISATWEYGGPVGVDAVEVWSIAWYLREEVFQGLSSQNHEALALYDRYLEEGHRLAAVGGSDNHWVSTSWAQGPGQPTTWIHAPAGDEAALLEGIRRNRTFVSWDWTGPQLLLEVDADASGYDAMTGDVTEAAGAVDVRVTVANGAGHRLRLVLNGEVVAETVAREAPLAWETTVEVPAGGDDGRAHDWLRAEALLEEDFTMRALTSPVYLAHRGSGTDSEGSVHETGDCECHPPELREAYAELTF